MSQENVDLMRRSYQAFNEDGLAGASEYWDSEIVWHTDPLVPEPGVYTGFDAVQTYLEGFDTRAPRVANSTCERSLTLGATRSCPC